MISSPVGASASLGLLACTALMSGCFAPDYGEAPFSCQKSTNCPEGYVCAGGVCQRASSDRDGGLDSPRPPQDGLLDFHYPSQLPDIEWVSVPGGATRIGSDADADMGTQLEVCHQLDEGPSRLVTVGDLSVMSAEVTQAMYLEVMGTNPSEKRPGSAQWSETLPVESVTWQEAAAFCNTLSLIAAKPLCYVFTDGQWSRTAKRDPEREDPLADHGACLGYRLPTEAEWEHLYRAGPEQPAGRELYNASLPGDSECRTDEAADQIAWYASTAGKHTHEVKTKAPKTDLGAERALYDLSGNVWELTDTRYTPSPPPAQTDAQAWESWLHGQWQASSGFVAKGGGYLSWLADIRAAARLNVADPDRRPDVGFRCVLSQP